MNVVFSSPIFNVYFLLYLSNNYWSNDRFPKQFEDSIILKRAYISMALNLRINEYDYYLR